jgi:hypothetical protein
MWVAAKALMLSDITLLVIVGLGALLVIVAAIAIAGARRRRQERSAALRDRFGTEYERTVERVGVQAAERELLARADRVAHFQVRDLSEADRARFMSSWTAIQNQFVDDPDGAVSRANALIKDVMRARGYSADEGFDQRAADLSVDHPEVIEHYRAARALAHDAYRRDLDTEQLRQAVVHYRALFADLLQPSPTPAFPRFRPAHA